MHGPLNVKDIYITTKENQQSLQWKTTIWFSEIPR